MTVFQMLKFIAKNTNTQVMVTAPEDPIGPDGEKGVYYDCILMDKNGDAAYDIGKSYDNNHIYEINPNKVSYNGTGKSFARPIHEVFNEYRQGVESK